MKSRTIFIGRWQMADGSWGERRRPELPASVPHHVRRSRGHETWTPHVVPYDHRPAKSPAIIAALWAPSVIPSPRPAGRGELINATSPRPSPPTPLAEREKKPGHHCSPVGFIGHPEPGAGISAQRRAGSLHPTSNSTCTCRRRGRSSRCSGYCRPGRGPGTCRWFPRSGRSRPRCGCWQRTRHGRAERR